MAVWAMQPSHTSGAVEAVVGAGALPAPFQEGVAALRCRETTPLPPNKFTTLDTGITFWAKHGFFATLTPAKIQNLDIFCEYPDQIVIYNAGATTALIERGRVVAHAHIGRKIAADFAVVAADDDDF